jgi:ribosomal protein L32
MKYVECNFCGHLNHPHNINCEGYDCGAPLDLDITYE